MMMMHTNTSSLMFNACPLTVVSCGSLAPVAHALYDIPEETTYMTSITYDCEEGYKRGVGGDWTRTCLENKQWSGTPPVCLGQCVCVCACVRACARMKVYDKFEHVLFVNVS